MTRLLLAAARNSVLLACAGLYACGGGGGGGGGSGGGGTPPPPAQPTIIATVIAFPSGAIPAGFIVGNGNAAALVKVTDQSGAPLNSAVVTVNGTALNFVATAGDYEGVLTINPGAAVSFSISFGATVYTAAHTQFNTYPTIIAPAANTTWTSLAANLISWSGAVPDSSSSYAVGVFDTNGVLVWPSGGAVQIVPTSQSSFTVPANSLTVGNRLVLVGIVDKLTVAGAAPGSAVLIGGFNYAPITIVAHSLILSSIATSPMTASTGLGKSTQLTATGTYADGSTQDLTTQVNWSSSSPATATVSSTGAVTGVGQGQTTITAQFGSFSASTSVDVFQATPSQVPPLSQTVAYQIDYAHSGFATFGGNGPAFPPTATWSMTLNGNISYPLVVGGKVFVITDVNSSGPNGSSLYALDEVTGNILWGPISIPGPAPSPGPAYDQGRLFVLNSVGLLRSFDPATGAAGWTAQLPGNLFTSPPTAANSIVFVDGGAGLIGVDETNGSILWNQQQAGGIDSSPTVSVDGVFVAHPCQVFKVDPVVGTILWHYNGPCEGGGGVTAPYANNQLYVLDEGTPTPLFRIYNAETGAQTGTLPPASIPALSAQSGYFLDNNTLTAIDQTTHNTQWTFVGDGGLVGLPIVIDSVVVAASSSGTVYALNVANGAILWSGSAGAAFQGTGLGAGEGYLVVPAGKVITAWRLKP